MNILELKKVYLELEYLINIELLVLNMKVFLVNLKFYLSVKDAENNLSVPACDYNYDCAEYLQYTGIKDCNNVEIYEGDIIENFLTDRFEIKYIEDKARFSIGKDNINKNIINSERIKVIGNIYENPELLLEK